MRLTMKAAIKSALLRYSGLSAWRWQRLPPGLYCFNYHRIGDWNGTPYDPNVFSCSRERFAEQAHFLKQNFNMISLKELRQIVAEGTSPRERLGIITFDDGYMDNHQNALPVLLAEGLSAVFFVSTDLVGDTAFPWWDQVAWWVRHGRIYSLQFNNRTIDLNTSSPEATAASIRQVLVALKSDPRPLEVKLSELESRLNPDREPPTRPAIIMGWNEIKSLVANGMAVGSHTCGHQILSHLTPARQAQELTISKHILEEHLNTRIDALAYPVGDRASYNEDTLVAAAAAGYRLAFTFTNHINALPVRSPLEISRLGVDSDMDARKLQQRLSKALPVRA